MLTLQSVRPASFVRASSENDVVSWISAARVSETGVVLDGTPIPHLATGFEVSDDLLSWTFTLREGVKFHDGTPLSAQDVKATFDKIIFPPEGVPSARKAFFRMVESVEAPDATTLGATPVASSISVNGASTMLRYRRWTQFCCFRQ